jgi:pSer/pThr/pTyr-binding forkhead associated (FHA) protein
MIHGLDATASERLERAAGRPGERKTGSGASFRSGGKSFEVGDGASVLGRDPDCDIPVEDPRVSWRHASVKLKGGSYVIEDLGSRNGTWLNEERIAGRSELRDEDVVRVGATQFVFREASEKAAPGEASPHEASPSPKEGSVTGMIRGLDTGPPGREK